MADIQPKNTDTIRVNSIKEKTGGTGVTIENIAKIDDIREDTGGAGVSLNQIVKFLSAILPLTANIDLGTSTAAQHIKEAFIKELTSNGQALTLGTDSAHSVDLKTSGSTRVSLESDGDLAQDGTNGGNLLWTKASTAVAQAAATSLTAAGTIITDALDLTAVFNHITTAAASSGVQLWDAPIGSKIEVVNSGANAVNVFPHSGTGTINGAAGGAAVSVATNAHAYFVRVSSTNWIGREITSAAA